MLKHRMNRFIACLGCALSILLSGCNSLIKGNELTEQKKGERVFVLLEEDDSRVEAAGAALLAAVIPKVIDFGYQQVEKAIEKEERRYKATWTGLAAGSKFYVDHTKPAPIGLKSITINRSIIPKDEKDRSHAFNLVLKVVPSSDHTYFRLIPSELTFEYAKAKTRRGDDDVDVAVTLRLHSYWFDDNGKAQVSTTEIPPLVFKSLKLGTDWKFAEANATSTPTPTIENLTAAWLPAIPRTKLEDVGDPPTARYSRGVYAIEATVDEHDDFDQQIAKVSTYLADNKEKISSKLGEAVLKAIGVDDEAN